MRVLILLSMAAGLVLLAQDQPSLRDCYYGYYGIPKNLQKKAAPKQKSAPPKPTPARVPETTAHIIKADLHRVPLPPEERMVALKYEIKVGGNYIPVNANLHNNDQVQLEIQTNSAGYLYVVDQESDGSWQVMFPSATSPASRVEAERSVILPGPTQQWTIEDPPGVDRLLVAFTLKPVQEIEELFPGFQKNTRPNNDPPTVVAMARLDNSFVDRLRDAKSRNLREGPVTQQTPPDHSGMGKEDAVYVVNVNRDDDSPLITEIRLRHQ